MPNKPFENINHITRWINKQIKTLLVIYNKKKQEKREKKEKGIHDDLDKFMLSAWGDEIIIK